MSRQLVHCVIMHTGPSNRGFQCELVRLPGYEVARPKVPGVLIGMRKFFQRLSHLVIACPTSGSCFLYTGFNDVGSRFCRRVMSYTEPEETRALPSHFRCRVFLGSIAADIGESHILAATAFWSHLHLVADEFLRRESRSHPFESPGTELERGFAQDSTRSSVYLAYGEERVFSHRARGIERAFSKATFCSTVWTPRGWKGRVVPHGGGNPVTLHRLRRTLNGSVG